MIPFRVLGLIFALDQLVLPMFRLGPIPFKPSFVIFGMWAVHRWLRPDLQPAVDRRELWGVAIAFGLIIAAGVAGEVAMSLMTPAASHSELFRESLMFALVPFAFGLGQASKRFRLDWLIYIFATAAAANVVLSLFGAQLPGLVEFYYSSAAAQDLGVESAMDVVTLFVRPRGIFGNPNISMLQLNIITLMIAVAVQRGLMSVPSGPVVAGLIIVPLGMATVLASRGEFVVASVISLSLARRVWSRRAFAGLLSLVVLGIVVVLVSVIGGLGSYAAGNISVLEGLQRILTLREIVAGQTGNDAEAAHTLLRPLANAGIALQRFSLSPLFGTGYSTSFSEPWVSAPRYYHNDWLRWIASTGAIGTASILWVIRRYCWPLGPLVVLPFILPGLTNTFILSIPTLLFYFFMIGVLRAQDRAILEAS